MLSGKDGGCPGQRVVQSFKCQMMKHEEPTLVCESFAYSLSKLPTCEWHLEDTEEIKVT